MTPRTLYAIYGLSIALCLAVIAIAIGPTAALASLVVTLWITETVVRP